MKSLNLILINGPMGSGKSTVAKILKQKLKRTVVFGGDEIKWFISDFKRNDRDNTIVHKVVLRMCDEYLKNGISLLLVQGYFSKEFFKIADKHKCNKKFYYLTAPRKVLLDRIGKRPMGRDATSPIPKSRIVINLRRHSKMKHQDATIIDTSTMKPVKAADLILQDLKKG
jgi:cytidylate kinase